MTRSTKVLIGLTGAIIVILVVSLSLYLFSGKISKSGTLAYARGPNEELSNDREARQIAQALESDVPPTIAQALALPDSEYALVPIFFGTNRTAAPDVGKAPHYGSTRGQLHLGIVTISVPRRTHVPGRLERPGDVFWVIHRPEKQDRHILIAGVRELDQRRWIDSLRTAAATSARGELLVYVHGFNNSFDAAALRTGQLAWDLGMQNAVTAMYSWPSKGDIPGYPADEASIEASVPDMKRFLTVLLDSIEANVTLLSHSMGTRAVTTVLRQLRQERPNVTFHHVILAAPDIDAQVFAEQIAPSIIDRSSEVTLYASRRDKALLLSKQFHQYARAGEGGSQVFSQAGIEMIDASYIDTDLIGHGYFAENKQVIDDLFMLIRHDIPAGLRNLHQISVFPDAWKF